MANNFTYFASFTCCWLHLQRGAAMNVVAGSEAGSARKATHPAGMQTYLPARKVSQSQWKLRKNWRHAGAAYATIEVNSWIRAFAANTADEAELAVMVKKLRQGVSFYLNNLCLMLDHGENADYFVCSWRQPTNFFVGIFGRASLEMNSDSEYQPSRPCSQSQMNQESSQYRIFGFMLTPRCSHLIVGFFFEFVNLWQTKNFWLS